MDPIQQSYEHLAGSMIKELNKRNMDGYYCATAKEAVEKALSLIEPQSSVAWGGSATLQQTGMLQALKDSPLRVIDRDVAQTPEEKREIYFACAAADYYFMSTNAITHQGELINIDATGNRLACLLYGPRNVIIMAGMNKVVPDTQSGIKRVRNVAAPPNTVRLGMNTPCSVTGYCGDCQSEGCLCCETVITRRSREAGRIKVILIGENLGF